MTKTIAEIATANSWSDATVYSSFSLDSYITVSCTSGSNTGKYYSSDDTWRMYANENAIVTVSAAGNNTISSITFTFAVKDNGTLNYGNNSISSASPVVVSGSSASFTVSQSSGTKGKVFISEISVTYSNSGTTPSTYYLTLPSGLTGGTVTASGADDLTSITAGTEMTVTATPSDGYVLDWMKANGTVVENPYTFNIYVDTEITAAFKEKPTYLFYESFNGCEGLGGNDGKWNGNLTTTALDANTLDNSGWGLLKAYPAKNCARFGAGSDKGVATTPNIDVITGNVYALSFKAGAWDGNSENTDLIISALDEDGLQVDDVLYSDPSCTTVLSSVSMSKGEWTEYIVYLKPTSSIIKIEWSGQTSKNSRFFIDEVLLDVAVMPEVATPIITLDPAEGPYYEGDEVTATITCATEGATISYSIDGTNWSNYTQALTITETTTIQAKATLNNVESLVATKTVTFVEAPTTVADIAGFIALDANKEFTFTGDVVVTYVNSTNSNYVWVKDDSGSALFYELGLTPAPAQGDIIKGGWSGKKSVYEGLREITNVTGATIEGSATVTPAELTLADINENKQATYGWLRGVTITSKNNRNFTISDGTSTVNGYNTYNNDQSITVPDENDGKTYDILGVVNVHGNAQFTPVQFVAEPEPDYYLVGSFNQVFNEETNKYDWIQQDPNYKFTALANGSYTFNGTMPDDVLFKVLKVKGETVTWLGGSAGDYFGITKDVCTDIPLVDGANFKMEVGGKCNFTISSDMKLTIEKTQLFMRGSFDGWSASGEEMTATETGWTLEKQLDAGTEFGFNDGWNSWHGGNGKEITADDLGEDLTMVGNGNFKIVAAGNYTININKALSTLVVTKVLIPHNIVVDSDIENGTIEIKDNKTTAVAGETVTIVVTPDDGYILDQLTVMAGETAVEVNDLQFMMPDADVTVTATFKENPIVEVMFDYRKDAEFAQENASDMETSVKNGISIIYDIGTNDQYSPKWYSSSNGNARVYVNNTITIDGGENYIEKVVFSFEGSYSLSDPTTSVGTYSNGTWTLGSDRGVLTADKTARIAYIIVYVDKEKQVVQSPVITGETPFLENTTVTITCATAGAEIRYTTDGEDPTAESQLYSEPFTLTEAATVKAIAIKGGNNSSIVSKEFKKISSVATIAEYLALDNDDVFVFTGDVVVTYQNGSNTWIKDATGYALIFASEQPEYSNGDVIPSGWGGKKTTYNNVPEITNPTGLTDASETAEANPVVKTVADITTGDVNAYYQINDIVLSANSNNFNIIDGENELVGYNKFNITMPEDVEDITFNVVGVMTIYNNKPEFYIISYKEIFPPVVLDGVSFTADRHWATWCGDKKLEMPEGVTAYVVTGVTNNAVQLEEKEVVNSGEGVLLYCASAMSQVTATVEDEATNANTNLLVGCLQSTTVNNAYVLYNDQFILAQDGTTVGAHRCYLPASASTQGAPRLLIGDPGTVTGIEDLRYDSNGKPVGYYDLTGRYVGTSLNGKRGIFITSDGKKVVR